MSKGLLFETVNEKIGEDYKRWGNKDCIFISAPTGSGKTTFILNTLLPYLADEEQRVLYLVNRRILKSQLEKAILDLPHEYHAAIEVALYQEIEKALCSIQNKKMYKGEADHGDYSGQLEEFASCNCVVCDEAHYFLADSNYNTNTSISYLWIRAKFDNKLSIFMSATCEEIRSYVQMDNIYRRDAVYTAYYNICKSSVIRDDNGRPSLTPLFKKLDESSEGERQKLDDLGKRPIKNHDISRDYRYIDTNNIHVLDAKEDIADLVVEGNGKWLIFIDNIKRGKKLKAAIRKKLRVLNKEGSSRNRDDDLVMITSGYKRDKEADKQVERIIKEDVPLAKVFITTSVLDNGINIKDIELRNVILFADTETEFIQMLGRKRRDELPLNLYIYRYDKNHFCNREKQLEQRRKIADDYLTYIRKKIKKLKTEDGLEDWFKGENKQRLNDCEKECIERQHIKLMQKLADQYIKYKDISSVFTVYGGKWYLNRLAFQHIENLHNYYQGIIKRFKAGEEDAFVKEQLRWLGKEDEAEKIIEESKYSRIEKTLEYITTRIREAGMEWMTRDECKKLKNEIKKELMYILEKVGQKVAGKDGNSYYDVVHGMLYRTTSYINSDHVEFLNKYCYFPFKLEQQKEEQQGKKVKKYRFVELKTTEDKK